MRSHLLTTKFLVVILKQTCTDVSVIDSPMCELPSLNEVRSLLILVLGLYSAQIYIY